MIYLYLFLAICHSNPIDSEISEEDPLARREVDCRLISYIIGGCLMLVMLVTIKGNI
jgi:hypothetical protein